MTFAKGDLIRSRRFPDHLLRVTSVTNREVRVKDLEGHTSSTLGNVDDWELVPVGERPGQCAIPFEVGTDDDEMVVATADLSTYEART